MQALKFNLSGKTAIFKRPDVNVHCYFTYSHIHKLALLGILGAICGFSGYNQQKAHNDKQIKEKQSDILEFPEFYKELKDIKVSVIPKEPTFSTKKQNFNDSTCYSNQDKQLHGCNLVVTEQWLENPAWEIFILLDESKATENLKQRFLNREFVFIPYLGKNDHFANITDVKIVDLEKVQNCSKIASMVFANKIDKTEQNNDDWEDETDYFKYSESLPVALDEADNQYILEKFVFTNYNVKLNNFENIYSFEDKNIAFF